MTDTANRTYYSLDALRGVAAVVVVTPHTTSIFGGDPFLAAFAAVDLFFILSGFVIMHAYQSRLNAGMSAVEFMRLRLIRLYPLYFLGFAIALLAMAIQVVGGAVRLDAELVTAALLNSIMLPSPADDPSRVLYVFNFPAWSLFFELIVNVAFAVFGFRLSVKGLLAVVGVAGAAVVVLAWRYETLDMGFSWVRFWGGVARATFGFFLGVLLLKLHNTRRRYSSIAVVLIAAVTVFSFLPGLERDEIGYYKFIPLTLCVSLVLYPALIWVAARIEPGPALLATCSFLGAVSYAIYVLHVPLFALLNAATDAIGVSIEAHAPWTGLMFIPLVVLCAWLADRSWDRPIRAWALARR